MLGGGALKALIGITFDDYCMHVIFCHFVKMLQQLIVTITITILFSSLGMLAEKAICFTSSLRCQ